MKYILLSTLISSVFLLSLSCSDSTKSSDNSGKNTFMTYCITCHGANGKLGLNGAKDLTTSTLTVEQKISVITNGRGGMASYKGVLSSKEIQRVAEYISTL